MKKLIVCCFILLILATKAFTQTYIVERVIDGDTLVVKNKTLSFPVRLVGIDCPEVKRGKKQGQPYAMLAKEYIKAHLENKEILLHGFNKYDRYNRPLVLVFYKGVNVNLILVRKGLAKVYRGRTPKTFDKSPYIEAQKEAQEYKRCIWSKQN